MSYKTSFNGLELEVKGIYTAYNLTPAEINSLRNRFCNQISCSGTTYTISSVIEEHLWMNLYVHELWEPIRFDIKDDYLRLKKSDKILKEDIEKISQSIQDSNIHLLVSYRYHNNTWTIENYNSFLEEVLEKVIKML